MSQRLKIATVDDIQEARENLARKIETYMDSRWLKYEIFEYESGEAFVSALETEHFDIVFMDIYMGKITGIDCAGKLRMVDRECKLVFVTSTTEFWGDGYSYNPSHYLVKPFGNEAFEQAMNNCQIRRQVKVPYIEVIVDNVGSHIDTTEIIYIDTHERNAFLHLTTGRLSVGREFSSISDLLLTDTRFIQSIKGVIINMDFIATIDKDVFVLKNGERLLMALRNKSALIKQYRNYQFELASSRGGTCP